MDHEQFSRRRATAGCLTALPLAVVAGCGRRPAPADVAVDLTTIDDEGLRGTGAGRVAVSYEFAIPDTPAARDAVRRIDRSVEFMPGSRGRVGATAGECLCIGSTHQPGWRDVLARLAEFPGVERIVECHHE